MGCGKGNHFAVVRRYRNRPAVNGRAKACVCRDGSVCRHTTDLGSFIVIDGDIESPGRNLTHSVYDQIGHFCGAFREESTRLVRAIEVDQFTVVPWSRNIPCHVGTTLSEIVEDRNILRQSKQDGHFCIDHRDAEVGVGLIPGVVDQGVLHHCRSDGEGISGVGGTGEDADSAVVGDSRELPVDDSGALGRVIVENKVCRNVADQRRFCIQNGNRELMKVHISVVIRCGNRHFCITQREDVSRLMAADDRTDSTIVLYGGRSPRNLGVALTGVIS